MAVAPGEFTELGDEFVPVEHTAAEAVTDGGSGLGARAALAPRRRQPWLLSRT
jgi:hypothetical protein